MRVVHRSRQRYTDAILREIGYSPDDIDRLRADKVVANEPVELP